MKRRTFLKNTMAATMGGSLLGPIHALAATRTSVHLSCNLYTWFSYYRREGKDFYADMDAGLAQVKAAGLDGIEPALTSVEQVEELAPLLEKYDLAMRSVYVNSKLHESAEWEQSIEDALKIASRCKALGTSIVVTNPSPLGWGSPDDKTDDQLRVQAKALDRLGAELRAMDLTLAYHTHDSEFRAGAREFHHMMLECDPKNVTFCLDVHWIYRGAGHSNVALFDILKMYGERITELHIRQSSNNVWTEVLEDGDIDYRAVVSTLAGLGLKPQLVLEQAAEEGTAHTLTPLEAHRRSVAYAREVFAPVG